MSYLSFSSGSRSRRLSETLSCLPAWLAAKPDPGSQPEPDLRTGVITSVAGLVLPRLPGA